MTECTATRHGTHTAYSFYDCRCPDARQAHTRYQTQLRLDHLHGVRRSFGITGVHRRLQALTTIGWTDQALADELGVTKQRLNGIRQQTYVRSGVFFAIAALYVRLRDTDGGSGRAKRRAQRNGWLGPGWWDDDTIDDPNYQPDTKETPRHWSDIDPIAVERAVAGDDVPLTRAERITVANQLHNRGIGLKVIAQRLGIDQRQVTRDLHTYRAAS